MGREVRMVPPDWQHPKNEHGNYEPLLAGPFSQRLREWNEGNALWQQGLLRPWTMIGEAEPVPVDEDLRGKSYEEWAGDQPKSTDYMPEWPPEVATHLMMYEDTTEGTPISPAFATPEELARWLADNDASACADDTATYEEWLATIKRGWALSAVLSEHGFESGVRAESRMDQEGT